EVLEAKREIGGLLTLIENQDATIGQLQEASSTATAAAETVAATGQRRDQIMDALIGGKGKPPSFANVKKPDYFDWSFKFNAFIGNRSRKALEGVTQVGNQGGSEAYRRLRYQCDPQNVGSILSRLMKALEFGFGGESEFLDNLAKFENLIEECEKLEDIEWNTIKKVTSDYLPTKQSMPGGPAPMGVGWAQTSGKWDRRPCKCADRKGGKGRDSNGNGKDSKGQGKDRGDEGGKDDGKPKFQGHCGRRGKSGHKQKDCRPKTNEVDTGDWGSWNEGWNTDDRGKGWGGQQGQGQGEPAPAQPSKVCDDESAWIFAVGTCDGSKGTRVGLPRLPDIQGAKLEMKVANGAKIRRCGDKQVNPKTESDDEINVKFHVADVMRPTLSVTSINIAGAGVELPPSSARGSASIARDSKSGRKRLGLIEAFGLFFLRATVMACAGAKRGARGLVAKSAATDDATPFLAQEVDQPIELAVRMEATAVTVPREPAKAEREAHEATHCPCAARFADCVAGRGLDDRRERLAEVEGAPVVQIGCMFGQARRCERVHPVKKPIDNVYHATASVWCVAKGSRDMFVVKCLRRYVEKLGHEKVTVQCDPENAAKDVAIKVSRGVGKKASFRTAPKTSKGSGGVVGGFHAFIEGMTRTWRRAIGDKCGIVIELRHPIMAWIVRRASWTRDRFLVRRSGYKTSFERQNENRHDKKVVPLGETMMRGQPRPVAARFETAWGCGIYLGRSLEDDARICGARQGIIMARSVRRLVESERYDKQLSLATRGAPSGLKAANASAPVVGGEAPNLNLPQPARLPGSEVAAARPQEGKAKTPETTVDANMGDVGDDDPQPVERRPRGRPPARVLPNPMSAEFTPGCSGCVGISCRRSNWCLERRGAPPDAPLGKRAAAEDAEPAPEPERTAGSEEPQSSAGKRSSDDSGAPAEGEAPPKERNIGAVTIANVTLDPNFELLGGAYYDDDDGEHFDPNQVHEGIKREAKSMESLGVGGPVLRPCGKKAWGTRWCHREEGDGVWSRFVAGQFKDAKAGDFFACASRAGAVRALMAAALLLKHVIATTDFSAAFMRAPVKDGADIYVEMPPECGMGRGFAWELKKSLYGLREAALRSQEYLESIVVGLGFEMCAAEPAAYHGLEKGIRVVINTGDLLASGPARRVLDECFDKLAEHLVIEGRFVLGGDPVIYLGSSLQRFDDVIVDNSKPGHVGHPRGVGPDLTEPGAEEPLKSEEHSLYRRCCGKIQYAIPRRLGVMYPLKELGRRLSEPRKADMKCLKHLLRYLNGARDMAMAHRLSNDWRRLRGCTGSDLAGCHETRKSTCCGIVRWCGVATSACARAESVLAQSSPEVEYLGAVELAAAALEKCRSMLGLAAVDMFGSAVVAALSAGRSARFLATFMILGVLDECDDADGTDCVEFFVYGDASGADGRDGDGGGDGADAGTAAACDRGGRPRMQLACHLDDHAAMVHVAPNCPALANRARWMVTRGTCSVRCAVLPAERATLCRADSPETLGFCDHGCRGLSGR
ncbi:unnamed protein product, partial [Prorocentrum cordatum]